jgi:hypothetical protein
LTYITGLSTWEQKKSGLGRGANGTELKQLGGLGGRCKPPSGVRGGAPAAEGLLGYLTTQKLSVIAF